MGNIKAIRTEADYEAALARVAALMDAEAGTPAGDELDVLANLVEHYEEKNVPALTELQTLTLRVVPGTEKQFDPLFLQGMVDRMATSFFKYGDVKNAYPTKCNALVSLFVRLIRYVGGQEFREMAEHALLLAGSDFVPGNTEWLMDVANFAMIEFMFPRRADAHFRPTDAGESPGRVMGEQLSSEPNTSNHWKQVVDHYKREGD